jgi:hypothetical protein
MDMAEIRWEAIRYCARAMTTRRAAIDGASAKKKNSERKADGSGKRKSHPKVAFS